MGPSKSALVVRKMYQSYSEHDERKFSIGFEMEDLFMNHRIQWTKMFLYLSFNYLTI